MWKGADDSTDKNECRMGLWLLEKALEIIGGVQMGCI